jgi:omega-6 fatty acid desaturase (delta-12 desaturase)
MLQGRELILATKPFAKEIRWKSWFHTLSTLLLLIGFLSLSYLEMHWGLRLFAGIFSGLMMVRFFVIYHDHQHQAILQRSVFANFIFTLFGIYILAPTSIWKRSHDYHHNHNSKLFSASIGSYPIMTVKKFHEVSPSEKRKYLMARHPITIFLGYLSMFLFGMCVESFMSNPKKHWDSLLAIILHFTYCTLVIYFLGWLTFLLAILLPFIVAEMIGAYLFYAQHNFPGVVFRTKEDWTYAGAAMESSSYMKMNFFWRYVTANIGYHHIHHMNSRIPFYRLPEVMEKLPEMQQAKTTSLHFKEIIRCVKLKCWDPEKNEMVGFTALEKQ